jgi:hypothetical protein
MNSRLVIALVIALVVMVLGVVYINSSSSGSASSSAQSMRYVGQFDMYGKNDYRDAASASSPEAAQQLCMADPKCQAVAYRPTTNMAYFKSSSASSDMNPDSTLMMYVK